MTDLDSAMGQAAFGGLIGVSQQAVSDLVGREVLRKGDTARQWLLAYCEHMRQMAAGRDPDGLLSTERARVAKETADKIAMQNAVARREYAPVSMLELVLAEIARQIATRLDSVGPQIRRRCPELPPVALAVLTGELAACRELCAAACLDDAERIAQAGEDEDDAPADDDTVDEVPA